MKKIFIAFIGLFTLALTVQAQKKSGAIQFETAIDPVAMAAERGIQLSEEMKARMPKNQKANFELLFTATNASYMPVEDTDDSNGGGGGGGMARMMRFAGGAGGQREYFYSFADQKLVEVFDLSDTTYVMQSKLTIASPAQVNFNMGGNRQGGANATASATATGSIEYLPGEPRFEIIKSNETKKIIGFNCNKAIVKTIRKAKVLGEVGEIAEETAVWYTTELGFNFSPNPNMWTEGTVLAIENKGAITTAKSIEYRGVGAKDVTAPKKALPITSAQYQVKMQNMMKRFTGGGRQGNAGGQVRSVIIN